MSTLYVLKEGSYLRKEGERLKVTYDGQVIYDVPMLKIDQVALFGPCQISTPAMLELLKRNIDVVFLTRSGSFRGRLQTVFSKNSILRRNQFAACLDDNFRLEIARKFILGKLMNMKTILMRSNRRLNSDHLNYAVERIDCSIKKLTKSKSVDEARGYEGEGANAYFYGLKYLIRKNFKFPGRVKRPPTDPVNSLLSFGYTLLFKDLLSICHIVGFDPYFGFLHSTKYGRPSLALDLMEEWRPVIIDSLVLTLVNKKIVSWGDFEYEEGKKCFLRFKAKKAFLEAYERKKRSKIKHPQNGSRVTYWRAIEMQAKALASFLLKESETYKPFLIK